MAQRTRLVLVDDITGQPIEEGDGETVAFGIDGVTYQIDVHKSSAARLRRALAPYIDHARKVGGSPTKAKAFTVTQTYDTRTVRRWAQARGMAVPDRGRIPKAVIEEFLAAGN